MKTNKFKLIENTQMSLKAGKKIFNLDMGRGPYPIREKIIGGKKKYIAEIPLSRIKQCFIKKG